MEGPFQLRCYRRRQLHVKSPNIHWLCLKLQQLPGVLFVWMVYEPLGMYSGALFHVFHFPHVFICVLRAGISNNSCSCRPLRLRVKLTSRWFVSLTFTSSNIKLFIKFFTPQLTLSTCCCRWWSTTSHYTSWLRHWLVSM